MLLTIILLLLILGFSILAYRISGRTIGYTSFSRENLEKKKAEIVKRSNFDKLQELNDMIAPLGFAYEPNQDIFYSVLNGWQKEFGYTRFYDEATAPLHMIVQCEPIYFEYQGKRWLIEFWKGQYGMTTGAEIGIYTAEDRDFRIEGVFDTTFYKSAEETEFLPMSISLWKNNTMLFKRSGWHWWLTGFVLGEFSDPEELIMEIEVIVKDRVMLNAFVEGLINTGYTEQEISIRNSTVSIIFDKPRSTQPRTQKSIMANRNQRRNEKHCTLYKKVTKGFQNTMDRIIFLQYRAPKLFQQALRIGKTKELYGGNNTTQKKMKK